MQFRTRRYICRTAIAFFACLTSLFTAVWAISVFYLVSVTFSLFATSGVTRLHVGSGLMSLRLNDWAHPGSRWDLEGMFQLSPESRDENVRKILRFELPVDSIHGTNTFCGCHTRQGVRPLFGPVNRIYTECWCSLPIPLSLSFVCLYAAVMYWRRFLRTRGPIS